MNRLLFCLVFALVAPAFGDEPTTHIHFRESAKVSARVVLLSDVADVDTADAALADKLLRTELVAAPSAGQVRSLRQRELIDHLQLNGFNLQKIDFSGAAMTLVSTGNATTAKSASPTAGRLSAAQRRVKQVVVSYLRTAQPEARRATIEVQCDEACATAASSQASTISVVAAEESGANRFDVIVAISSRGMVEEYTVIASTSLTDRVVVAARSLKTGSILTAADLKLGSARSEAEQANAFSVVEDLIGRELTRSVGVDQAISAEQVVQPRLIRKGDLVEVTAKSAGIRITTQAVAQQDGALGESITLEAVDSKAKPGQKNKEIMAAKVSGQGQAQIEVAGRALPVAHIGAEPARLGPTQRSMTPLSSREQNPIQRKPSSSGLITRPIQRR